MERALYCLDSASYSIDEYRALCTGIVAWEGAYALIHEPVPIQEAMERAWSRGWLHEAWLTTDFCHAGACACSKATEHSASCTLLRNGGWRNHPSWKRSRDLPDARAFAMLMEYQREWMAAIEILKSTAADFAPESIRSWTCQIVHPRPSKIENPFKVCEEIPLMIDQETDAQRCSRWVINAHSLGASLRIDRSHGLVTLGSVIHPK